MINAILSMSRFIEHGEYKNNQYGTSLESIWTVLARNKVCLVDVQPEVNVAFSYCFYCQFICFPLYF